MTELLPFSAAADDEPIPALDDRLCDGPDMRDATPIEEMLNALHQFDDDDVGYVSLYRFLLASIGCPVSLCYERNGEQSIKLWMPMDTQTRHRTRWTHFLLMDLERGDGRRDELLRQLREHGPKMDRRPTNARKTTWVVRDFIRAGGRILLNPRGVLEDHCVMRDLADTAQQRDEALSRYLDLRRRYNTDRQIKRAVCMLGVQTANGWRVLEAVK
ncbi:hypothetical protein [Sphingomonas sp. ACRSK]|uniref:hypothetical protein n=1 Tax=Sphingomonas sp. ACRSK TaxID=2918213 RepID=UPI001EF749F1|nr:hypothetical protein [Sphingomonas sp. ACRSK]MCG7348946.1 hypothetical protein [Sphingomonas sp. ACRSK]